MSRRSTSPRLHQQFHAFPDVPKALDPDPERIFVAERPENGATQVLEDRQFGEEVGDLEAAGEAAAVDLVRGESVDALSVQADFADVSGDGR